MDIAARLLLTCNKVFLCILRAFRILFDICTVLQNIGSCRNHVIEKGERCSDRFQGLIVVGSKRCRVLEECYGYQGGNKVVVIVLFPNRLDITARHVGIRDLTTRGF